MSWDEAYDVDARARLVPEPAKRVDAPERTPFERDRARVVHSAALRRLAAKTQVVGPATDDFVRNRLTHTLEVAQVARDLAHPLGCHPDLAETAALAHDLGHPPFGHNGERILDELMAGHGGFEGNAQTLRILTRLEAKSVDPEGESIGLNLTRATLDACTKYPWTRAHSPEPAGSHGDGSGVAVRKFGVYPDDEPVFDWLRTGAPARHKCVEAQVMDFADDVAYSVHDVEDGVVSGRVDLTRLDAAAVGATVRDWYLPDADDVSVRETLTVLARVAGWPTESYAGTRAALAGLKNLTSDLIGIFCGAVQQATRTVHGEGRLVRHDADVIVPRETELQIAVLKGIAAHYVMRAPERVALMERQRELVAELFTGLLARPERLDPAFAGDWERATDDAARARVVADQVASLTDASAVARHGELR